MRFASKRREDNEIDDDVVCDKNWLSELVKPYSDPEVGCVGGKILPKWEATPPKWIKRYPSYLSLLDLGDEVKEFKRPGIYGCNFSIRKSLLFEVGGFNPDAFGDKKLIWYRGVGEVGLLRKVLATGRRIIYTPQSVSGYGLIHLRDGHCLKISQTHDGLPFASSPISSLSSLIAPLLTLSSFKLSLRVKSI